MRTWLRLKLRLALASPPVRQQQYPMNFEVLTWLSRAIVSAVVLSTLWLAAITDSTQQRPRFVAGVTASADALNTTPKR